MAVGTPDDVITEDLMECVYGTKVKIMDVEAPVHRRICIPFGGNGVGTREKFAILEKLTNGRRN